MFMDVTDITDIMDIMDVTDIMDITDVTDVTDVAGVTDVTDITGGTVQHMAYWISTTLVTQGQPLFFHPFSNIVFMFDFSC